MAKFCGNCGAPANDNDRICGNCGAPLPNVPAQTYNAPAQTYNNAPATGYNNAPATGYGNPAYGAPNGDILGGNAYKPPMAPEKKQKIVKFGAIGAVIAVLIVIVSIFIAKGSGYKGALKKYFNAVEKGNWDKYSKVALLADNELGGEYIQEYLKESFEASSKPIKKIKYKVVSKKKLSKSDIEDFNEEFEGVVTVKKGYELEVKITTKTTDGKKKTTTNEMYVLKIDGKWKVISEMDFDSTF